MVRVGRLVDGEAMTWEELCKQRGVRHPEAYCLMHYRCEKCGKWEILWNSRDGVTPFCVKCRNCDGTMKHEIWDRDFYAPKLRMFIDLPPALLALSGAQEGAPHIVEILDEVKP